MPASLQQTSKLEDTMYQNLQEVAAIKVGVEDGEVGKREIMLSEIGNVNRNRYPELGKFPDLHRFSDLLSFVLPFPDGTAVWCLRMVKYYGTSGPLVARDREENVIGVKSSVQPVSCTSVCQP